MRMPTPPGSAWGRDVLLATTLTAVAQVELVAARHALDGPLWVQHGAFAVLTASVALRRTHPPLAVVVAAFGLAGQTLAGAAPVLAGFLALLVVAVSLGYHSTTARGATAMAGLAVVGTLADVLADRLVVADLVGNLAIVGGAWVAGRVVRSATDGRVEAEVARDRAAREAAVAERERIALDLHDSVAHGLTLMTLQAGIARERSADPLVVEALRTIEQQGRRALGDMHRALRLLSGPSAGAHVEAPGLADLPDLVAGVCAGGLAVDLEVHGDLGTVPPSVSSSAYRVVAEALTNAAKHSGATAATVEVRRTEDAVRVRVRDEGAGASAAPRLRSGSGRGLVTLRDRLALFGGSLSAGRGDDGDWVLDASIPLAP